EATPARPAEAGPLALGRGRREVVAEQLAPAPPERRHPRLALGRPGQVQQRHPPPPVVQVQGPVHAANATRRPLRRARRRPRTGRWWSRCTAPGASPPTP